MFVPLWGGGTVQSMMCEIGINSMVVWKMYSLLIFISFNCHRSCHKEKERGNGRAVNKGTESGGGYAAGFFLSQDPRRGQRNPGYYMLAEPRIHPDRSLDTGISLSLSWLHGSRHESQCPHSPSGLASISLEVWVAKCPTLPRESGAAEM